MTSSATSASNSGAFPFEFVADPGQDRELLNQLGFLPGLKEVLTVRQVHALEHATVWVLDEIARDENGNSRGANLGGLSTETGFYLYGRVNPDRLRPAVQSALHRLTRGEWGLAVHPRCGTNLSVGMLVAGGLALGTSWLLPKGPVEQLLGLGIAAAVAAQLSPDLGQLAQRYVTTAIPFNLRVVEVSETRDWWERPAHFVRVEWID
jgi:hypothetical protein